MKLHVWSFLEGSDVGDRVQRADGIWTRFVVITSFEDGGYSLGNADERLAGPHFERRDRPEPGYYLVAGERGGAET